MENFNEENINGVNIEDFMLKRAKELLVKDAKGAFLLLQMGAYGGNFPEAYYYLGRMYYEGYGVDKDINKGIELLEKSAEMGFVEAKYFLGSRYFFGDEVDIDYNKAFEYLSAATSEGHVEACNILADCYIHGKGTEKDCAEGLKWLMEYINRRKENDPEFTAKADEDILEDEMWMDDEDEDFYIEDFDFENFTTMDENDDADGNIHK